VTQTETPRRRLPMWIRSRVPSGPTYDRLKALMREQNLATVCEEARCPNVHECWGSGTLTVMIMGELCTRGCRFCSVKTVKEGPPLDPDEPRRLAESLAALNLQYVSSPRSTAMTCMTSARSIFDSRYSRSAVPVPK
jgi:lipoic acid synthetase